MKKNIPIIAPFQGVRYNKQQAPDLSQVMAPPYDVISEEGQKHLYARHPYNFVRLDLGCQFPEDTEENNRYTRAASDLKSWLKKGVLVKDPDPAFYLYEQHFEIKGRGNFIRRGFLALRRLEDFSDGKIRPHEKTLSGPKADRLLLMKSSGAQLSPIFSLYSDPEGAMARLLKPYFAHPPEADFQDEERVRHRIWRVTDRELFQKADSVIGSKSLFIADGHHRYETAVNYRNWMRERHPEAAEESSFNYVMMFFSEMSDPGLLILPTHRALQNRPGFDIKTLERRLREIFEFQTFSEKDEKSFLEALEKTGQMGKQAFGFAATGLEGFRLITLKPEKRDQIPSLKNLPPASCSVDTLILHRVIFQEILGFKEEDEKDPRYLQFIKDAGQALSLRKESSVNAVFLTNPPPMTVLRDVVEAGMILPPKTTFFYPKLLSGLVVNQIVPTERVEI